MKPLFPLLLLLLVACGPSHALRAPKLALDSDGAAPRRVLRYLTPPVGPEFASITVKTRVTTSGGGPVEAHDLPAEQVIASLTGSGDPTTVRFAVVDARLLDDVPTARPDSTLANLRALAAAWTRSPSGKLTQVSMTPAPDALASDIISNVMLVLQTVVRFPDEPIGSNAAWTESATELVGGVTWKRVTTYRIRSFDDTAATMRVTSKLEAFPQVISTSPQRSERLTAGTRTMSFEITVPYAGLVATGVGTQTSEMQLEVTQGRSTVRSVVKVEVSFAIQPYVAAAAE